MNTPTNPQANPQPTMLDRERHDIAKNMSAAFAGEENITRIPEALFVKYYLPFFRGDNHTEENTEYNNQLLENWFRGSGGPLNPVNVVDVAGNVMYQIPPFSTTTMFNVQRKEGATPFGEIVKLAHHYSLVSPVAEENHTQEQLEKKFREMYNKNLQITEREKMWFNIFLRYEKSHPRPNAPGATSNGSTVTGKQDDKFSDDEMIF